MNSTTKKGIFAAGLIMFGLAFGPSIATAASEEGGTGEDGDCNVEATVYVTFQYYCDASQTCHENCYNNYQCEPKTGTEAGAQADNGDGGTGPKVGVAASGAGSSGGCHWYDGEDDEGDEDA